MAGKKISDLSQGQQDILKAISDGWSHWTFPGMKLLEKAFNWWVNVVGKGTDDFIDWIQRKKDSPVDIVSIPEIAKKMTDAERSEIAMDFGTGAEIPSINMTDEKTYEQQMAQQRENEKGQSFATGAVKGQDGVLGNRPPPEQEIAAEPRVKPVEAPGGESFVTRNISPYEGPVTENSRGTKYIMHHGTAYTREDIAELDTPILDDIYRNVLKAGDDGSPDRRTLQTTIEQEFDWASRGSK